MADRLDRTSRAGRAPSQASVPSSTLQHAAGKATGAVVVPGAQLRGGRRHYPYGTDLGDSSRAAPAPPWAGGKGDGGGYPSAHAARPPVAPEPAMMMSEDALRQTLKLQPPEAAASRPATAPVDRDDTVSVAESALSGPRWRDRRGHGNILTWGNDSRCVTPTRKRQGRAPGQPRNGELQGF